MPRRPEQLVQELRDVLSEHLGRVVELPEGTIVTVTRATVSANGRRARIYLSVLPDAQGSDILALVQQHAYDLQGIVHHLIDRHPAPRLTFSLESQGMPLPLAT